MTGFGSATASMEGHALTAELRSVNTKGLDLRLRLPPGLEALEPTIRARIGAALGRGSVSLQLTRADTAQDLPQPRPELLDRLVALALAVAEKIPGAPPPRAEALLALPGVLRPGPDQPTADPAEQALALSVLDTALAALVQARAEEGGRLATVLAGLLDAITAHARSARAAASDQPALHQARLAESLAALLGTEIPLDPARLAQEVALLAARSDVREELDRLDSHIEQARALLAEGRAVGRRLDFLTQEFLREANTLCSKSASITLTRIGLALKADIDRLREQVQNVA